MFLLPILRVSRGECLDSFLMPGEGEALPSADPREVALRFQRLGAVGLHVVDVDAARGKKPNDKALVSILDAVNIPVQFGGGVTSLKRIQELRDTGAYRVVVGSMGVMHRDWMREAAKVFPKGVVANVDEKHGTVWVKGRTEDSKLPADELAREFDSFGFETLLLTSLNGTSHAELIALLKELKTPVMVSTTVRNVGELLEFHHAGVKGAVVGTEFYDRTIDFAEATKYFKSLPVS